MRNNIKDIEKYIEYTLLKPESTQNDIAKFLDKAIEYKFLGVCLNPIYVKFSKDYLKNSDLKVITVAGFPLGTNLSGVKEFETLKAIENGADEVDIVINLSAIKEKNFLLAEKEIKAITQKKEKKIIKVIIETDLLLKEEIKEACKVVCNAGADFIKTSTGFVKPGIGATAENIKLIHQIVSPLGLKVKASAGIKDKKRAIEMINAGASRLGTSSGIKIIEEQ